MIHKYQWTGHTRKCACPLASDSGQSRGLGRVPLAWGQGVELNLKTIEPSKEMLRVLIQHEKMMLNSYAS